MLEIKAGQWLDAWHKHRYWCPSLHVTPAVPGGHVSSLPTPCPSCGTCSAAGPAHRATALCALWPGWACRRYSSIKKSKEPGVKLLAAFNQMELPLGILTVASLGGNHSFAVSVCLASFALICPQKSRGRQQNIRPFVSHQTRCSDRTMGGFTPTRHEVVNARYSECKYILHDEISQNIQYIL